MFISIVVIIIIIILVGGEFNAMSNRIGYLEERINRLDGEDNYISPYDDL